MDNSRRKKRPGDGREEVIQIGTYIEKRLFAGRLPKDVTEEEVQKLFAEFGEITDCKIIEGKGVAYVTFSTWAAAHRALVSTDGQVSLQGHAPGQVMSTTFAERTGRGRNGQRGTPYDKGNDNSRIFVGGLPEDITEDEVRTVYERFGTVEQVHLIAAKTDKRCGFVTFQLWGEAIDAIQATDNEPFMGRSNLEDVLTVVFAEPRRGQGQHAQNGFEEPAGKRRRMDDYGSHGQTDVEYERVKAMYLAAVESGAPEPMCTELHWELMRLRTVWMAATAAQAMGMGGSAWSQGGGKRHSGNGDPHVDSQAARLFIGGLPTEVTDQELGDLVRQLQLQGSRHETEILECRVLPGRGCGYLRFGSWHVAEQCQQALDEREVNGWKQPLRAKWATPRDGSNGNQAQANTLMAAATMAAATGYWGGDGGQTGWGFGSAGGKRGAPQAKRSSGELDRQRLFIGQLERNANDEGLQAALHEFGEISDYKYFPDKGMAYVTYTDVDAAAKACEALAFKEVAGISKGEGLNVQFAQKRPGR